MSCTMTGGYQIYDCRLHPLLWMRFTTMVMVAKMLKQMASAIPAFIQILIPWCASIPTQHIRLEYVTFVVITAVSFS